MESKTDFSDQVDFSKFEEAATLTREIIEYIFSYEQISDFVIRLWNDELILPQAGGLPKFQLILNHPGALKRMLIPPGELTLGEAYLRGDFDVEGDMVGASSIAASFEQVQPSAWLGIAR